jgi:hypothetical protein
MPLLRANLQVPLAKSLRTPRARVPIRAIIAPFSRDTQLDLVHPAMANSAQELTVNGDTAQQRSEPFLSVAMLPDPPHSMITDDFQQIC